jgi:hypothetical protein
MFIKLVVDPLEAEYTLSLEARSGILSPAGPPRSAILMSQALQCRQNVVAGDLFLGILSGVHLLFRAYHCFSKLQT